MLKKGHKAIYTEEKYYDVEFCCPTISGTAAADSFEALGIRAL